MNSFNEIDLAQSFERALSFTPEKSVFTLGTNAPFVNPKVSLKHTLADDIECYAHEYNLNPPKRVKTQKNQDGRKVDWLDRTLSPKDVQKISCWKLYNDGLRYGYCFVCKTWLDLHDMGSWHAAHIQADANGGSGSCTNLRPTCPSCNYKCKTTDLRVYKRWYWLERKKSDPMGRALMEIDGDC